jgi:hypothetical protein
MNQAVLVPVSRFMYGNWEVPPFTDYEGQNMAVKEQAVVLINALATPSFVLSAVKWP